MIPINLQNLKWRIFYGISESTGFRIQKTYELYMSFPENENGYMNNVYGFNYEQFLE